MTDYEHFGAIARILSPPRRAVLQALAECGPMTPEQIAACWLERDPDLTPHVVQNIDRAVSQSLWKLKNLGMVAIDDGTVSITAEGRGQLAEQSRSSDA